MEVLIYFLFIFVIFFAIYYLMCMAKFAAGKQKKINELSFLKSKYKLDLEKINISKILIFISLFNSFIIALTGVVAFYLIEHIILLFVTSIFLLFSGIYFFYIILFKILINKEVFIKKIKST